MFKKIASATVLLIAASNAFAGEPNTFYAGADVGKTRVSGGWSGNETSYGAFAGYNLNQNFAVEAGYRRLGEHKGYNFKDRLDQTSLSAIASMPVGESFSVFGRLGVSHLDGKVRFPGGSVSDSTNKALAGVGVSYAFAPNVSGRVEFQKAGSAVRNLSAGVAYQF